MAKTKKTAKKKAAKKKSVSYDPIPNSLVDAIRGDKCIAYVGAGLSRAAGFPTWGKLLKDLADECERDNHASTSRVKSIRSLIDTNDTVKFLLAAEDLRECLGPDLFISKLADTFQTDDKQPTPAHDELTKIGFRNIITTNYDKLLEFAYAKQRGGRVVPTYTCNDSADIADAMFKGRFFILKAHGDVDKRTTLVITEKDYRELFYRLPGYKMALSTMFTTQSVLFIGASLGDPELWLLLGFLHDCFHGSGTYHYALVPRGDQSEAMFNRWKNDFQVQCIHYDPSDDTHPEVHAFLKQLAAESTK